MKSFSTKKELLQTVHSLASGEISISTFLSTYTYTIEEVLEIAKREKEFTKEEVYQLTCLYNNSLFYQTPFDRERYKECCAVMVDGKKVKATDKQIDACISYIRENDFYECDFTVRTLVALYLSKKLDMESKNSQKEFQKKLKVLEKKKLSLISKTKK